LPGFSTPSTTTTSGSGGSSIASSRVEDGTIDEQASPPERQPREDLLAHGLERGAGGPQRSEGGARVVTCEQRLAHEHVDDVDTGFQRAAELSRPIDERQARPVALAPLAQRDRGLDAWVREARQDRQGGGGHRRHHAPPDARAKARAPGAGRPAW
jgi:hypothetical protein